MFGFLHTRRYSLGRSLIAALTLSWLTLVFQACALGAPVELPGQPDGLEHVPGYSVFDQANVYFDGGASPPTMGTSVCPPEMCQTFGVVANIAAKDGIDTSRFDSTGIPVALAWSVTGRWSLPVSKFWFYQPGYIPPQPALKFRVLLI
ncbi:MAG TPA: hypothetical protein ENI80_05730 [Acidiferrobacteraceae bacterium]|nr:hypothetical protein [Acidiferrobacteraceae bacterium]